MNDKLVKPFDDQNIKSNGMLIRGIPDNHILLDDEGNKILSSTAFAQSSGENGGMSVFLEQLILLDNMVPQEYIMDDGLNCGAVYLNVGGIRLADFQVGHPIQGNPYNGDVCGKTRIRYNKNKRRKLRALFKWWCANTRCFYSTEGNLVCEIILKEIENLIILHVVKINFLQIF